MTKDSSAPLGVFDSGIGGLTVTREIRKLSPGERIVYIGDTAHVPYGGHTSDAIRDFSLAIGRCLTHRFGCRAVVVACNRATAAAVDDLRAALPVPVIGMEPGVRPAAQATRTGKIGVLATPGTTSGGRFAALLERHARTVEVITQPCPGWVECVERGDLDGPEARALVEKYVAPLLAGGVDTLVLGCTHYPLLRPLIEAVAGPDVAIIDTGPAVARQVERVAPVARAAGMPDNSAAQRRQPAGGSVLVLTTGKRDPDAFAARARLFLGDAAGDVLSGRLCWKQGELYDDAGD